MHRQSDSENYSGNEMKTGERSTWIAIISVKTVDSVDEAIDTYQYI